VTNDTAAIQMAINAVAGTGGTLLIPDGTYMINPIADSGRVGLRMASNMTLRLSSGAILKAITNSAPDIQHHCGQWHQQRDHHRGHDHGGSKHPYGRRG